MSSKSEKFSLQDYIDQGLPVDPNDVIEQMEQTLREEMKKREEGKKFDDGKPMLSLLPPSAVEEVGKVLSHGASKYGKENWKLVNDFHDRYISACLRHIMQYQNGEVEDEESGLHHLAHAICSLMFIVQVDKNNS